jgi:hypothetical protein
MASVAEIPRSRGAVCGLLLILLGAWGGLIPFVGPYFHYAFTPDKAWAYTSGRLYLEIVPGAVVLLGGLIMMASRSRALGGVAAFAAALGGAWFVAGTGIIEAWGTRLGHITPGTPAAHSTTKALLEVLGFFTGLGVLIVFFAALALGRFSLLAAKDAIDYGSGADFADPASQFPASPSQDPFPATTTGQFATTSGQFAPPQEQFPPSTGQFPPPGQKPFPGDEFPPSRG